MIEFCVTGPRPSSVSSADIRRAIHYTFRAARRREEGSVAVAFVSNAKMRALNRRFRHQDRSTDVLSFRSALARWGDIVLAPTYIRSSARAERIPFREELLRVTIHGALHLFGEDHVTKKGAKKMFRIQERVVRVLSQVESARRKRV